MKNIALILYITLLALINNIYILPIILLTLPFTNKILNIWINIYFTSITGLLKYVCNVSIHIKNSHILHDMFDDMNNSIVIQNHLAQWDFLIILLNISKKLCKIKIKIIGLYQGFMLMPGMGLFGLLNSNIMLCYNKIKNLQVLEKCKNDKNDWIYLYPEGNIFCEKSKQSSDKYCKENNIIPTKNCLYPRFGALEIINKNNNINTIYSLCTQYDNVKPSKKYHTLLNHTLPKNIFINIKKTHVKNLVSDTVQIYRDMDEYLDKEININEYIVADKSFIELLCLLFHLLLFIYNCSLLYNNYFYGLYLGFVMFIYYSHTVYLIK